jgi:hypothetical protein
MTTARIAENGVLISTDLLKPLGLQVGDDVQVVATSDGISLRKPEAILPQQLEVAQRVMDKRRDVLRRLAE